MESQGVETGGVTGHIVPSSGDLSLTNIDGIYSSTRNAPGANIRSIVFGAARIDTFLTINNEWDPLEDEALTVTAVGFTVFSRLEVVWRLDLGLIPGVPHELLAGASDGIVPPARTNTGRRRGTRVGFSLRLDTGEG